MTLRQMIAICGHDADQILSSELPTSNPAIQDDVRIVFHFEWQQDKTPNAAITIMLNR